MGWSQRELAQNAGINRSSVAQFELELRQGSRNVLEKMQIALEDAGVEFTNGNVRVYACADSGTTSVGFDNPKR